jgi:hypothetical protein|uniref:Uncharacterized protein n=1 Tax=viral metagenome TaxID=1070528 RepID=A0A6C0DMF4_9ZZZZ
MITSRRFTILNVDVNEEQLSTDTVIFDEPYIPPHPSPTNEIKMKNNKCCVIS